MDRVAMAIRAREGSSETQFSEERLCSRLPAISGRVGRNPRCFNESWGEFHCRVGGVARVRGGLTVSIAVFSSVETRAR